jgi:hypothetical protein
MIGPMEIARGDVISIVYSGENISDSFADLSGEQGEVEIKILDALVTAGLSAIGGDIASAVSKTLDFIGDPVGQLLGVTKDHPCNGQVFSDTITFTGC